MKKLLLTLTGVLSVAASPSLEAAILLNEVHLNPPNPDDNYEFIELKSTLAGGVESCAGLSIVIINNDKYDEDTVPPTALNIGEITEVYDLNELSTGANGLLLLGNGYNGNPRGGPWAGFVDAATAVADPAGMGDSDVGSNDGITILLVSGFTGSRGADLDTNNDQVLDSMPWATILDSIGTRDRDTTAPGATNPYVPGANQASGANIFVTWAASTLGARDPDTFARHLTTNTPSSAGAWYGGKLIGAASTTVTYQTTRIFGPNSMLGEVTPGRPNLATSLQATSFLINEVGLNPVGDNDRFQFIEIINTNGQARSLNGYWLILLDSYDGSAGNDESPGGGQILEKWDLSSMATGSDGLLLIGNDFSSSYNPFNDLASPLTGFADPVVIEDDNNVVVSTGFGEGDIRYKNGFTLLLVQNFVAPANPDFDSNNDGTMEGAIPGTIVDQVGFDQIDKTTLGKTYATSCNLRPTMGLDLAPDNLSRKAGNLTVGSAAWYGGEYENSSAGFNVCYGRAKVTPPNARPAYDPWFGGFRGAGTPGLPNLSAAVNPAAPPVAGSVRISEVMFNPTNTEANDKDDTNEYIELTSTTGGIAYLEGLWVIVVDLEGSIGKVIESFPLDGNMTGLNGIATIGDNYDDPNSFPYRSVDGPLTPFGAAIDPVISIGGNDLPNDGLAVMILRGPKTGAGNPFTLTADGLQLNGDLDPENDGTLLSPVAIATEVVDSIAVAATNPGAGYGWISTAAFKPDHVARYPGNPTANSAAAYYYGKINQQAAVDPSLAYTTVFAGNFKGAGSPGRPNHAAATAPTTAGNLVFNEVHVNPPGADRNFEFIEFIDTAGRARSLNSYYLLMMDNVSPNTGSIRAYWSLDGMSTGTNGLFVLGNRYPLGGINNPFSAIMRTQTNLGDPAGREGLDSSLSDESFGRETDNLSVTFLLVRSFNRSIGFDTDIKVGAGGPGAADSQGDGVFDQVAWTGGIVSGIHDSILYRDNLATDPAPPIFDGFSYGLADLTSTYLAAPNRYYHPESFARFHGENTPNSTGSWYGGDLVGGPAGNDGDDTAYAVPNPGIPNDPTNPPFPAGFTGRATPGQPNLTRNGTSDTDGDGIVDFLELAFNSNLAGPDSPSPLPDVGTVTDAGSNYAALSYRRLKGGTTTAAKVYGAEAYTYTVETSADLQTWSADGTTIVQFGAATLNADGVTETATFRLVAPLTAPAGKAFMRLRVGRQ